MNDVCFIVRDKNGQGLGYFYYEVGARPAHGRQHAHQGRAWRLAVNFAKLPELLRRR